MKWRCLLAVLLGLSITDVATFAQRPPEAERLPPTPSSLDRDSYFGDAGMARFQLIEGRLRMHPSIHRKGRESSDRNGHHESISVQSNHGIPSLQYSFHSPQYQLSLSVKDAVSVRMEVVDRDMDERHVLEQFQDSAVRWSKFVNGQPTHREARSLFHLRGMYPREFDQTFGDIVDQLLHGRSFPQFCDETEAKLVADIRDQNTRLPNRTEILSLIDQLASPRRIRRDDATNQLLRLGTPVLPLLRSIPVSDLEPEQVSRIQHITKRLKRHEDDTCVSWAAQLAYDWEYLSLLASKSADREQQQINQHLVTSGFPAVLGSGKPVARIASKQP